MEQFDAILVLMKKKKKKKNFPKGGAQDLV